MKFKKVAALCMAMVMATSVLTACGDDKTASQLSESKSEVKESSQQAAESSTVVEEESKEIVFPLAEPMEFSCFAVMAGEDKVDESPGWIALTEMANLDIEVINVNKTESAEKGSLLIVGGDYPDFFMKIADGVDTNKLGMEGIFIPLEDLIRDYAPNLTALLDERNAWNVITAPDGHVYTLPYIGLQGVNGGQAPGWINGKWLERVGMKEPTTMDELYNVLKAFKEQDANGNGDPNDEIPYTFSTNTFTIDRILNYMPDALVYFNTYFAIMNDNEDELVYYPMTESFKENYVGFLTKLYEEKILDHNGFTQTFEQMSLLGKAADIYGMHFRSGTEGQNPIENHEAMEYVALQSPNPKGVPLTSGVTAGCMAITDKCENPEVLIAWLDYFYTEEGGRLVEMGIEGEHYVVNEDGTYTRLGKLGGFTGSVSTPYKAPELVNNPSDPVALYYEEQNQRWRTTGTVMPTIILTEDEAEVVADINADVKPYVEQYVAQVVTGQLSLEDSWDDYIATLKAMRVDDMIKAYQDAYARTLD